MEKRKGFTLLELLIVISMMNIMATIAIAMYVDYTKKARTAEVPLLLRALVQRIIEYANSAPPKSQGMCELVDSNGQCLNNLPKKIEDTGFVTNTGTPFGNFFEFKVSFKDDCSPRRLMRFAYAVPIIKTRVPDDYQYSCMNSSYNLYHDSDKNGSGKGGKNK